MWRHRRATRGGKIMTRLERVPPAGVCLKEDSNYDLTAEADGSCPDSDRRSQKHMCSKAAYRAVPAGKHREHTPTAEAHGALTSGTRAFIPIIYCARITRSSLGQ